MFKHSINSVGEFGPKYLGAVAHDGEYRSPNVCHGSTLVTWDALLKEDYIDNNRVEELIYPDNVCLGKLEKRGDTGMVGDQMPVPIIYGLPQGVASGYTKAASSASNIKAEKFVITAGDYHGVVLIGDKVMMASRTNQGAFLENKVTEIDGLYEQAGENYSKYIYGNGGQSLGVIATVVSNVITLVNSADAMNFEVGMTVVASASDGSDAAHTLNAAGATTTVTAVNRATGSITLNNASTISAAFGDNLFRSGDFFGDQGVIVIKGISAFMPASDSLGDLWGLTAATRAKDVQRFGGCRVDPTLLGAKSFEQRIKLLFAQMTGRFKAKAPTAVFMHPEDFDTLDTAMGARGQRDLSESDAKFGYSSISVTTTAGKVPIFPDRHCPLGDAIALRMDNWWLFSMGELFHVQNGDGLQMLRKGDSTDYEFRIISYAGLACNAPKNNGRVSLTV
jgi:hypothetical protein